MVGPANLGTTLIVALGFAMLGLSTFRVTSYVSLLLPAILLAFDRRTVKHPVPHAAFVGVASGAD